MVQILPRTQRTVGEELGSGVAQGLGKASDYALQLGLENFKNQQRKKLIDEIEKGSSKGLESQQDVQQKFLDVLPKLEQKIGRELTKDDLNKIWDHMNPSQDFSQQVQEDPFSKAKKYAAVGEHDLAQAAIQEAKLQENRIAREEKRMEKSSQKAEKYLDEVTNESRAIREQKFSIAAARQAVEEGKAGILSGDFWVSALHLPDQLKSASAATIDSAAKTHLISSMQSLTGRPNVFMEQQINRAFALPGASKEGNLARLEVLETYADMKDIVGNKALEIADQYESRGKPLPGKINRMAAKESAPALKKREKQSLYRLQELMEPPEGSEGLGSVSKVIKGTPLTHKKAQVIFKKANPRGDINNPTEEEVLRAEKLAEGLGYDIHVFDSMEQ